MTEADDATSGWTSRVRRLDRRLAHRAAGAASRRGSDDDLVVAMTGGASSCEGSVLAFSEYLHVRGRRVVWVYDVDPTSVPAWATAVRAGSARHRYLAARSRWWVTDGLPLYVSDPDTKGGPLERGASTQLLVLVEPTVDRVGADLVDWPLLSPRQQRLLQRRGESGADLVAVPSADVGARAARALGLSAPQVVASPLVERLPDRARVRARLGIPADAPVVGFLGVRPLGIPITDVVAELPGMRAVADADTAVRGGGAGVVADAGDVVAASDVIVTDTSPWAVVAARVDRPIVVFAPDLRDLLSRGPGLYPHWPQELPGPHASSGDTVAAAVQALHSGGWRVPSAYEVGHRRFADLVTADVEGSCRRLVEAMWGNA
jgi:hypothetical protein